MMKLDEMAPNGALSGCGHAARARKGLRVATIITQAPYGAISSNLDDSWRYENLLISINSERRCEMVEGNSQGC